MYQLRMWNYECPNADNLFNNEIVETLHATSFFDCNAMKNLFSCEVIVGTGRDLSLFDFYTWLFVETLHATSLNTPQMVILSVVRANCIRPSSNWSEPLIYVIE